MWNRRKLPRESWPIFPKLGKDLRLFRQFVRIGGPGPMGYNSAVP